MTFKAKICTPNTYPSNQGRYRLNSPYYYLIFTKDLVLFPEETKKIFSFIGDEFITPWGNSLGIKEREKYKLVKLSKYSIEWSPDSEYQVIFERGLVVNIRTDWWNDKKMRFIHRKEANWQIITSIFTILIFVYYVLTFFIPIKSKSVEDAVKQTQKSVTHAQDSTTKTGSK